MKKFLFILAIVSNLSCGLKPHHGQTQQQENASDLMLGTWVQTAANIRQLTFKVTQNSFSTKAVCTWPNGVQVIAGEVTLSATVSGTSIQFNSSSTVSNTYNSYQCEYTLNPGKMIFEISGRTATVKHNGIVIGTFNKQ